MPPKWNQYFPGERKKLQWENSEREVSQSQKEIGEEERELNIALDTMWNHIAYNWNEEKLNVK